MIGVTRILWGEGFIKYAGNSLILNFNLSVILLCNVIVFTHYCSSIILSKYVISS